MNDVDKLLAGFGLTLDELQEQSGPGKVQAAERKRDGRICACGHPMSRHETADLSAIGKGVVERCVPVRSDCACSDPKPVLLVSDERPFIRKSRGHGPQHALMLGLGGLLKNEKAMRDETDEEFAARLEGKTKDEIRVARRKRGKTSRTGEWMDGWPRCELDRMPLTDSDGGCTTGDVMPYLVDRFGKARTSGEEGEFTFMLCPAHGLEVVAHGIREAP